VWISVFQCPIAINDLWVSGAIKVRHKYLLGVRVYDEVWIVCDDDYLACLFSGPKVLAQVRIDRDVVEIVVWLVND